MRVGFTQETEDPMDPEIGTAEANESDENVWFEFWFPKMMDFFMIYGAVSFVKDVIEYVKPKGGE